MEREQIDWKKRGWRRRTSAIAMVRRNGGSSYRALVGNLSYDGCQILSEQALTPGETLVLSIPGKGTVSAQVRWVDGDRAGLRFLAENSVVDQRRARLGV